MLDQWAEILGKKARYEKVPPETYQAQIEKIYSSVFGPELSHAVALEFTEHMCYYEDIANKVGNWKTDYIPVSKVSLLYPMKTR